MRTLGLSLLVVGLALAAAPATAVTGTSFTLASVTKGSDIYWALNDANGEKNPRLEVPAGASVTITVNNADGGFHNLKVGGTVNQKTENIEAEGDTKTLTFTMPASGTLEYVCEYHASTMKGTIAIQGAATTMEEKNESPGLALLGSLVALVGVALVLRRK